MTEETTELRVEQPFEREERYVVFKRSRLTDEQNEELDRFYLTFSRGNQRIPTVECVVVEDDWPEYETVWKMIEARVTGNRPAAVDADGVENVLRGIEVARKRIAPLMKQGEDAVWRPAQFAYEVLGNAAAALTRPQAVDGPCTMGVGCDEAGVCYAEAHGEPERCPRHTAQSLADQPASDVAPERGR